MRKPLLLWLVQYFLYIFLSLTSLTFSPVSCSFPSLMPKPFLPSLSLKSLIPATSPSFSMLPFPLPLPFSLNSDSGSGERTTDEIKFYLYPFQRARNYSEELKPCSRFSFDVSHFNPHLGLIVITHGFMENYKEGFPQRLKNAYLAKHFPANIVLVDWHHVSQPELGSKPLNLIAGYPIASKFVITTLGSKISSFLTCIIQHGYIADPSYIHLIGFSLGAHASGLAGSMFHTATGKQIGRITGLDPAGVDYHLFPVDKRLDKDDAYFVDVVHTNKGFYGILNSIGDVDFWVNGGGTFQPGCNFPLDFIRDVPGLPTSCSHARAWDFFIQSIKRPIPPKACPAADSYMSYITKEVMNKECSNPIPFGQHVDISAKGDYYLQLRISPYY